jgi:tripartite-type tricarboxylate transporter receptor subunit TctC
VSSASRSSLLPTVPAVANTYPQFDVTAWMGLFLPAGTPRELANKIGADFIQVVKRADMRERLAGQGAEAIAGPPEQLADLMRRESAMYAKVIREIGLSGTENKAAHATLLGATSDPHHAHPASF